MTTDDTKAAAGSPVQRPVGRPVPERNDVGGIPVGYVCELTALHKLLSDIDSLPLHAHKRAAVRDWIEAHVRQLGREAEAARRKTPNVRAKRGQTAAQMPDTE